MEPAASRRLGALTAALQPSPTSAAADAKKKRIVLVGMTQEVRIGSPPQHFFPAMRA